ncbi:MAG: SDR family oxidoreductase, partial [bacterium]|nr:SDR family oxidoreductase [bacterium]
PETISYVEAHGTGTHLGDPIELRALPKALPAGTGGVAFCALGSVKTNLGHLDAAAGISGLIKTVLALDRRQLPPSLHFEEPNSKIDFAGSPFYVNTALAPWSDALGPRRAGVSSFGFGGTNSHVVVEQAPPARASGRSRPWQLLVVSAKSEPALEAATDRLRNHLAEHPDLNLADVAYTLKLGRRAFRHRRAVVAPSCAEAVRVLEERDPQLVYTRFQKSAETPVVFLFSGQGAQYVNMARELYLGEPTFRDEVDRCSEILESHLGVDLRTLLYPPEDQVADAARRLEQTSIAQPALFVVEVALAGLWREWGVRPQAMIGHSIGEYAAAYLAGVFALEDALALVAARGRLMQEMPAGAMLSVALAAEEVRPLVGEALSLAAVNGPGRCVVSGPAEAIDAVARQLVDQGVQHRSLHTSHAFHSAMMDPILEPFLEKVREVRRSAPQIPFLSNVTGGWISDEAATDPHYWVEHLRKTVRFSEGLGELLREPERVLLEVGPGNALHTFAREHPRRSTDQAVVHSLPHPNDRRSDLAFLLTAAARLWLAGVEIDGAGFYARERRHRVPLPSYPFEHQRYWIEPQLQVEHDAGWVRSQKSPEIAAWFYLPVWRAGFPRAPLAPGQLAAQQETWLVFVDGCALGSEIVDRLKGEAQRVMTVTAGSRYARLPGGAFTVNPHRPADYQQLIQDLEAPPNTVIHLWNVSQSGAETPGKEGFKTAQTVGYYSLLFLAQALAAAGLEDPLKLVVVSRGLHDVSGLEESYPEKATLLGPCMVIPQEHQHILCLSIDVAIPGWGTGELATQILAEAASQPTDLIVAYRGNRRWVQAYERTNWQAPKDLSERLRDQGVYLITGGLGNIGMLLAEYLARTVRARLVLLGRSALPPRDEWTRWLATHDEQEAKSRRIRKILALEQLGAEVLIARADVADPEQMRSVIETIDERFGELHGVIHTAGILQGESIYRPLTEMGHSESEVQFGPKVYGLYVLEEVLAGRTLDFCVLLSSNAAVLGGLGFVGYSAANLFMDAFAANRGQRDRLRWISSNWDEWPGAVAPGERTLQTSMAEFAMTREESFDAFHRVISQAPPGQVVVSTGDLEPRLELWIRPASKLRKHEGKRHARPALETSYVAPTSETEQLVADLWQEILGIEQVGRNDNFFDLGGHSLLATQLMSRVRGALEIELPVESLFEAPTVAGLTRHIEAIRWATLGQEGLTGAAAADRDEGEL